MEQKRKYFSLEKANQTATLNIYGDITSYPWEDYGEVSANNLSKQLDALGDVNEIHVFINSYGGEVAEGLAIYNSLRRHKAKVVTYCDGFACSIASVIFMAGDERVMNEASLLMIHNAWTFVGGNAEELRKQADDLEKITQASVEAYKAHSVLTEKQIKKLMSAETWILPEEAVEYGFATKIDKTESKHASQNAFMQLLDIINAHQKAKSEEEEPDKDEAEDDETKVDDEPTDDEGEGTGETDEEPEKEEDEEPDEEPEKEEPEETDNEKATQRMSCFFNAILKM